MPCHNLLMNYNNSLLDYNNQSLDYNNLLLDYNNPIIIYYYNNTRTNINPSCPAICPLSSNQILILLRRHYRFCRRCWRSLLSYLLHHGTCVKMRNPLFNSSSWSNYWVIFLQRSTNIKDKLSRGYCLCLIYICWPCLA